jgi:shikimate dehydrogenase
MRHHIDGKTELFGIIGNPVSHTLSPVMHNAAFASLGMNRIYVPMAASDAEQAVNGLRSLGFRGASVTVPHKETVIPFLDAIDPVAEKIGAVNTLLLKKNRNGGTVIEGSNTDWLGASAALAAEKIELPKKRVVVAGAGGSAKAVAFGLAQAGAEIVITNRTAKTGKELAAWLHCEFVALEEIYQVAGEVLINTTTVGMTPDAEGMIVPASILSRFTAAMDIVYAPLETCLLRTAKAAGCKTVDGLAMLLHQGAAQFKLWTGVDAPLSVMRSALEEELRRQAGQAMV